MRNILILIILISGLIFTSLIKNKTRLLEKELLSLNNEINSLSFKLSEASLDFEYLTTPKHISLLARNFLDENFSYFNESQIKKSINVAKSLPEKDLTISKKLINSNTFNQSDTEKLINKKSNIVKEIETKIKGDTFIGRETVKYLAILQKLINENTFSQSDTEKLINKKSNVAKEIDNTQLLITKKVDKKQSKRSKKIAVSKKVHNWAGLQIVKSLLGISTIPIK